MQGQLVFVCPVCAAALGVARFRLPTGICPPCPRAYPHRCWAERGRGASSGGCGIVESEGFCQIMSSPLHAAAEGLGRQQRLWLRAGHPKGSAHACGMGCGDAGGGRK